jgi:hypothetical protein
MKILEKKEWDFMLYEEGENTYLEVVCGTSAIFEVKVKLSGEEVNRISKEPAFIKVLAEEIRNDPEKYTEV